MIKGIFGFEIFDSGIFLDRKMWQVFLVRIFLGIQNNLKIRGSARVSRPRSSANKVQQNLFLWLFYYLKFNIYGSEIWHGIFLGLIFGPGIFFGFVESPRDFLGFDFFFT